MAIATSTTSGLYNAFDPKNLTTGRSKASKPKSKKRRNEKYETCPSCNRNVICKRMIGKGFYYIAGKKVEIREEKFTCTKCFYRWSRNLHGGERALAKEFARRSPKFKKFSRLRRTGDHYLTAYICASCADKNFLLNNCRISKIALKCFCKGCKNSTRYVVKFEEEPEMIS